MISRKDLDAVKKPAPKNKSATVPLKAAPAKKSKKKAPIRKKSKKGVTQRISREAFATALIANSMNTAAAYKAVSPKVTDKTAAANGHKLLRETEVIDILTPKLQKLFIDAGIEADYVFKRWVEMSQASPYDYFRVDEEGHMILRDSESLTHAQRLNCRKIKITMNETTDKDGERIHITTRTELETVDQQKAVSEIAKHLGLLMDRLADEDVDKIGDLIEQGVSRIKKAKDLDAWKSITFESEVERT